MQEEILPPELRKRREDLDGFGDIAPQNADESDAQAVRRRLESRDMARPVVVDFSNTEDLQRALVAFRRLAQRRDKARHHEILMLAALVFLVLATLFKALWPFVSNQSGRGFEA
ncbi:hypothetical protein VMCG_07718 [Cytospora schulzeri]|uniref:Transmembrane protein n=1 Tax=Cytospora schulzeri TaxID=448051 RepID=A0A423VZ09_9PEZI|nr:hypothetical protein VMCG_07718 [Valsa malicola]